MEYHKTFTGQNENHDIRNTNNTMTLNTNIDETVTKLGKQVVVFQTKKDSPLEKVKRNKEREKRGYFCSIPCQKRNPRLEIFRSSFSYTGSSIKIAESTSNATTLI